MSLIEVIVVDDGSQKPVSGTIKAEKFAYKIKLIRHEQNKARAAACNAGINAASNEIIVILDDDISLPENLLRLHAEFHENPDNAASAAIGALEWGENSIVTPAMYFLENSEKYYPLYPRILHDDLPFMTTANCSIGRDFLIRNGLFDESFREYGYEDVELGERLRAKGLKIKFLDNANVPHQKTFDLGGAINRQFTSGKTMALYYLRNSNGSMGLGSLTIFNKLASLNADELNREVSLLSGLEGLFSRKRFWEMPEYHIYFSKLNDVLGTYNSIGAVEGLKKLLPEFNSAFPRIVEALLLVKKREYEQAVLSIVEATRFLPGFLPLHSLTAEVFDKMGKTAEALKLLELLRERYPSDLHTILQIAEMQSKLGGLAAACEICREKALFPAINPLWRRKFISTLIGLKLGSGHVDAAVNEAAQLTERYSTDPYLQYNIASLFEKNLEFEVAESMFNSLRICLSSQEDCFEFKRLRSGIHYHLGKMKLLGNRRKEALMDFSWSVKYNVAHREAAVKMQELRAELGIG